MAVVGPLVSYGLYKLVKKLNGPTWLGVFLASALGDLATYMVTSVQLGLAFPAEVGGVMASVMKFMGIFAVTQVPLAISEGILTVIIFNTIENYAKEDLMELNIFQRGKIMKNKRVLTNVILLLLVVFITIIPFFVAKNGEFGGSDDQAEEAITQIDENYEPWFSPLFEPASGEIESLLFALQAAIGAGVIGFGLGYLKGKRK